jgi:DNA-binding transcriptional regulator PaaX
MKILDERPDGALRSEMTAKALWRWATAEREAWLDAVTNDPLLPERLLPSGYLGQTAWQRRVEVLRQAGSQLQTFTWG